MERSRRLKGQREEGIAPTVPVRAHDRPWRNRAIDYGFLSTGLRQEELLTLDLDQIVPYTVAALRQARQAWLTGVNGNGGTEQTVFLSADARQALADYLEQERPPDAGEAMPALFLTATGIPALELSRPSLPRHDQRLRRQPLPPHRVLGGVADGNQRVGDQVGGEA